MKCKTYKRLYKLFPVIRWQAFLADRHFSRCPRCLEEFAVENHIHSIGITPQTVETALEKECLDIWPRIEKRLNEAEYKTVTVPRKRTWGWALAGTAALVLALLVPITTRNHSGGTGDRENTGKQDRNIIITSVTVENRPAKTIYFQPENKNRLIVWIKKK
jgi:hypothetical protein